MGNPLLTTPMEVKTREKKVYQIILNFLLQQFAFLLDEVEKKKIEEIIGILTIYLLRYIQLM